MFYTVEKSTRRIGGHCVFAILLRPAKQIGKLDNKSRQRRLDAREFVYVLIPEKSRA